MRALITLSLTIALFACADDEGGTTLGDPCAPLGSDVTIEYFGAIDGGQRVIVTRPDEDELRYEDFRVFLGYRERMLERDVQSVRRERDGGSTTIELTLDGRPAMLDFPVVRVDAGVAPRFEPGPATLELGDETLDIELLDDTANAQSQLVFFCR